MLVCAFFFQQRTNYCGCVGNVGISKDCISFSLYVRTLFCSITVLKNCVRVTVFTVRHAFLVKTMLRTVFDVQMAVHRDIFL